MPPWGATDEQEQGAETAHHRKDDQRESAGGEDADMLAAVGFALFRGALREWLAEEGGPTLAERVRASLPQVRVVLDETSRTATVTPNSA